MPMSVTEVEDKLISERDKRSSCHHSDVRNVQLLAWGSVIASALTSIIVAYGVPEHGKMLLAVLAAVPALAILAEGAFRFSTRHRLNSAAAFEIERMRTSLHNGREPQLVYDEFLAYRKDFDDKFPPVAVPSTAAG